MSTEHLRFITVGFAELLNNLPDPEPIASDPELADYWPEPAEMSEPRRQRKVYRRSNTAYPPPTPQPTPCRLWQGYVDHGGYGIRSDGRRMHVWTWEQINGPVPPNMCVCHHCDQPACYRYDHLFLGTRADNNADMARKGRSTRGERNPQVKLTAAQAREILAQPDAVGRTLARQYNVSEQTICDIRAGRRWQWVNDSDPDALSLPEDYDYRTDYDGPLTDDD